MKILKDDCKYLTDLIAFDETPLTMLEKVIAIVITESTKFQ